MDKKNFGDLVQTGDGSYTILDGSIDEEYHSTYGARSEADELYMINSGFRDELSKPSSEPRHYQILDVGMGLAYNAMMTIDTWSRASVETNILYILHVISEKYCAVEKTIL